MRQVIIVGSGPAGFTAAIYAARANLEPLVVASSVEVGGELMNTTDVENFPGFPEGIQGPELMQKMQDQAERFGAEILYDDVVELDLAGPVKRVKLGSGAEYEASTIIYATGSAYRKLGLSGEERLSGHGVSWCATCDGFFFRDRVIAVVGGGDSAMEEATFLTRFASKVYVIHRKDSLRASKIMQERAFANEKIEFIWNTEVVDILGDDAVNGVLLALDGRRLDPRARPRRPLRRDRQRPAHPPRARLARADPRGHHLGRRPFVPHVRARRLRRRRRHRPDLPPGGHRRGQRDGRGPRRRALPRRPRAGGRRRPRPPRTSRSHGDPRRETDEAETSIPVA